MSALKASLEAVRAREADGSGTGVAAKPRKAAAKKAAAKKPAAKKAAAKKPAAPRASAKR